MLNRSCESDTTLRPEPLLSRAQYHAHGAQGPRGYVRISMQHPRWSDAGGYCFESTGGLCRVGGGGQVTDLGYWNRSFADRLADVFAATRPEFAHVKLAARGLRAAEIRDQQLPAALVFRPGLVLASAGGPAGAGA